METQKGPKIITQERLVRMFKDIKRLNSEDTRFCFLIGAGASKSSGIKTGWELAAGWYKALQEDLGEEDLAAWKDGIRFNEEKIGEFYPHLYQKRYEANDQLGYDEFKKLMEKIDPGLGYVILSQILTHEKHNFVITTNFDYLVEDAVRMFTSQKPFIAGHETLAEFISSNTERPTIIKVHRDLFLHPFNDEEDTSCLKKEWEKALAPILNRFHLLVIGYGGNDGSLMQYLQKIPVENRKSIYWCVLKEQPELNTKIEDLLTNKDFIVHIDGFDELMYAFNTALGYDIFSKLDKPETHPFVEAAKGRLAELDNKLKGLLASIQQTNKPISDATIELFTGANKYLYDAYIEKDVDRKEKIYQEGIAKYPDNSNLLGNYALFLHKIRKYDHAEAYYKKAIDANPKQATNLGNYAIFLYNIRKEYESTEMYYKKAIEADPKHATNLGSYALFLHKIRKDYDSAEEYYKKAIEADPKHANNLGNYAHFLILDKKDFETAEKYIDQAFEIPDNKGIDLLSELWFYRFAHYPQWYEEAEKQLEELIAKGSKSIGWNLQDHIAIAKQQGHPKLDKLKEFARQITT
jgi:Tfp pilus assembly protein PilF